MTASTSTLELVGWDDVKCRPIYRRRIAPAAPAAATKSKAHANKGAGTARVEVRAAPTTTRAWEGALPTVTATGEKKTNRSTVGGGDKRRKARTISLSPAQDAQKEVSRGRPAGTGVIARGDNAPFPLAEGGAGKCVVGAEKFATNARKRKKGYGASTSRAPGNAAASMGWGVETAVDESAPRSANDKCTELPVESDSPSLEEEVSEEMALELSVGSTRSSYASDCGREGNDGQRCSPCSTRSVTSHDESGGANEPSGDENMGDDVSLRDAASPFSPVSSASWGSHCPNEEPNHQSPVRLSEDESISSSHLAQKPPIDGPTATPPKAKDEQSPHFPTIPRGDIGTPSSGVRSDRGTSPLDQSPQTKDEGSNSSPRIDERCIAANNGTASGEPPNDTPFSKGGESTNSPYVYKRHDTDGNEPDEFDFAFDDAEPDALPNPNRRSYGDVKPVWMASKDPSALDGVSQQPEKVIGWDDMKCRPIYHAPPAQASTVQSMDTSKTNNSPDTEDNGSTDPNDNDGSDANPKRTQRKRVYTSLFNKKSGLSQAARDRMDIYSPVGLRPVQTPRETVVFGVPNNSAEATARGNDGETEATHSEGRPAALLDVDLEMEAIINDSNTQQPQPTSKSSLESARAFFRYLDTNHNLTILDQGGSTPKAKADVIRTNRRIHHGEQLRAEYVEYCKTVSGTGVDPISLNEFASNWNQYFTDRGVVRDGLLDEDD